MSVETVKIVMYVASCMTSCFLIGYFIGNWRGYREGRRIGDPEFESLKRIVNEILRKGPA